MRLHELTSLTEAPATDDMRNARWYHGTSNTEAAESILQNGIMPDQLRPGQSLKTTRGKLDPVMGRVYVTPRLQYATIYAIGGVFMGHDMPERYLKGDGFGYLFVIDGNELAGDVQPDEDSVGEFVMDHTEREWDDSTTPWRRLPPKFKPDGIDDIAKQRVWNNIVQRITPKQFKDAVEGFVSSQASGGKRALKTLPVRDMLDLIRWGAHVAHQGTIKPSECWRIDIRRSKEIAKDASNIFEIATRIL